MNKVWTCDTVAKTKGGGRAWIACQPAVPAPVVAAVDLLIDALPENRDDMTIKIHTSGLIGDWTDYVADKMPKPLGFCNMWVGYSNLPPLVA